MFCPRPHQQSYYAIIMFPFTFPSSRLPSVWLSAAGSVRSSVFWVHIAALPVPFLTQHREPRFLLVLSVFTDETKAQFVHCNTFKGVEEKVDEKGDCPVEH